ncbi:MAG: dihydrodipicolinate synthase family protein [Desulfobacteraceae bacterium]|nr:MAG: dihydrodipicolinate synthase family protein [Desulfobacteraceae bacterium]
MKPKDFKGIYPPMMTAFKENGEIYEKGTREIVDFIVPHVQGLYPCGTYGSGPMMSPDERKKVAEIVLDQVNGRVPVIVHVGTADTRITIELARHAKSIGAKAVGAITPYYNSYSQDAIFIHFQKLIHAVDIPVFLYDNPKCSGNSISSDLLVRLAKEGLAGIKDSTFDLVNYYHAKIALEAYPEMNLISGTEALFVAAFDAGATAAVTGLGNVYPDLMGRLYREYLEGDRERLMETQRKVIVVRQITKYGPTVPTCHAILKLRGVDAGYPRLPFVNVSPETERKVKVRLTEMGLL